MAGDVSCLVGTHLNTEAHNGHYTHRWRTGPAGTPAMMMSLPGVRPPRYQVEHTPHHHSHLIPRILIPLHPPLMKGGAVLHSLTRQQGIYLRTWEKWFPCVKLPSNRSTGQLASLDPVSLHTLLSPVAPLSWVLRGISEDRL